MENRENESDGRGGDSRVRWTVREVAAYLRVSEEHVRRLARAGRLRGVKLPGLGPKGEPGDWRFDPVDVEAVLAPKDAPPLTGRAQDIATHVQAALAGLERRRGRRSG